MEEEYARIYAIKPIETTLYVHNLPEIIDERTLSMIFSMEGRLRIGKVRKTKTYAFIHFESKRDAIIAFTHTNGIKIGKNVIGVMWAEHFVEAVIDQEQYNLEYLRNFMSDCHASMLTPKYTSFERPLNLPDFGLDHINETCASAIANSSSHEKMLRPPDDAASYGSCNSYRDTKRKDNKPSPQPFDLFHDSSGY